MQCRGVLGDPTHYGAMGSAGLANRGVHRLRSFQRQCRVLSHRLSHHPRPTGEGRYPTEETVAEKMHTNSRVLRDCAKNTSEFLGQLFLSVPCWGVTLFLILF